MTGRERLAEPVGRDVDGHALIELQRLSKFFGNVIALQNITTSVHAGEVTCVLGDNGAGKSTFIKILAGVHRHDEGHFLMEGEPVTFHSPREAKAAGIATVYQDLAMAPLMSIWRNFFLGSEPTTWLGTIDMTQGQGDRRRGDGQDGHRRARPGAAGRHAVGRRAPVAWRSPAPSTSAPRC